MEDDQVFSTFGFEEDYYIDAEARADARCARKERVHGETNFLKILTMVQYKKDIGFRRTQPTLDVIRFCSIPLDILFEVFGFLHPIDILHLSYVLPDFESLLQEEVSDIVWRQAFKRYRDLPEIPEGTRGYRWAALLFGPTKCEECGSTPAPANVTYLTRLCRSCTEAKFDMHDYDPDEPPASWLPIAQYIIACPTDSESLGKRYSDWPRIEKQLLREAQDTLWGLQLPIDAGEPEAEKTLKELNARRVEERKNASKPSLAAYRWACKLHETYDRHVSDHLDTAVDKIRNRLQKMGYAVEDTEDAEMDEIQELKETMRICGVKVLSKKRFNKLLPVLTRLLDNARKRRLERERKAAIRQRTSRLDKEYMKHKQLKCIPSTWEYMPPTFFVKKIKHIEEMLQKEGLEEASEEEMAEALSLINPHVDAWLLDRKQELLVQLPVENGNCVDMSALDLATSVFSCLGSVKGKLRPGRCLIGYAGALPHYACPALEVHWEKKLHFNRPGYDAAIALVIALGLDPQTTGHAEMDRLDRRFVCNNCPSVDHEDETGKAVFAWRDAIYHYILESYGKSETHPLPDWTLLSPSVTDWIKQKEGPDPVLRSGVWCCNLCGIHRGNAKTHAAVLDHIRTEHGNESPVVDVDYFQNYYAHREYRGTVILPDVRPEDLEDDVWVTSSSSATT